MRFGAAATFNTGSSPAFNRTLANLGHEGAETAAGLLSTKRMQRMPVASTTTLLFTVPEILAIRANRG